MGAQDCLIALSEGTISPDAALQQARQALDEDHVAAEWAVPACLALWKLERHREAYYAADLANLEEQEEEHSSSVSKRTNNR